MQSFSLSLLSLPPDLSHSLSLSQKKDN
uniref:Uncharacterized protein n=1 Tax=Anguilla anguilla TaxID=7936 RepID=A0A0E9WA75_ANGAN